MDCAALSKVKILEYSEAFRQLAELYDRGGEEPLRLQLSETASMLKRILDSDCQDEYSVDKLLKQLKVRGFHPKYLRMERNETDKLRIIAGFDKFKRGCILGRELAENISELLDIKMEVAISGRQIVTSDGGEIILEERPQYKVVVGSFGKSYGNGHVCGDVCSHIRMDCGIDYIMLADGMGCGQNAHRDSVGLIEYLEKLLETGFGERTALTLLNRVYSENESISPVSLDMCSINSHTGLARFSKMGAVSSFIKRGEDVRCVKLSSLPAGYLGEATCDMTEEKVRDGEYVVLLSDGVMDAFPFYNKERKIMEILSRFKNTAPEKMAENLISEALFYDADVNDDMTCIVAGIFNRK